MGYFQKRQADAAGRKGYVRHVKGNRLSDAGRPEEAKALQREAAAYYERALELGCARASYLMAYGVLLLRFRDYEKAKGIFLKCQGLKDLSKADRKQLRINFAVAQWKLGALDSAIEQLTIAAQDGKNTMIYGSLGYMLIERAKRTGEFDEAVSFNQEAYEYDEEDAVVLDNLGQLKLAMGERDEAKAYFLRAHEIKPRQVDTLYYLALLTLEDGDRERARELLSTALKGNYSALSTVTEEQARELFDRAQ